MNSDHRVLQQTAQRRSYAGVSRHLRHMGLSPDDAAHWAHVLMEPETRCAICGLPNYELARYWQSGPWFRHLGRRESGRRLHLDHIHPGENDGHYRALCPACNSKRGAAVFSDADVLRWVRDRWRFILPLRFLWWLNKTPGEGGRLHRSDRCAKRDARFAAGRSGTPVATPPPDPDTPSPPPDADGATK